MPPRCEAPAGRVGGLFARIARTLRAVLPVLAVVPALALATAVAAQSAGVAAEPTVADARRLLEGAGDCALPDARITPIGPAESRPWTFLFEVGGPRVSCTVACGTKRPAEDGKLGPWELFDVSCRQTRRGAGEPALWSTAVGQVGRLASATEAYAVETGAYPDPARDGLTLCSFLAPKYVSLESCPAADPWGSRFLYLLSKDRKRLVVGSTGPGRKLLVPEGTLRDFLEAPGAPFPAEGLGATESNVFASGGLLLWPKEEPKEPRVDPPTLRRLLGCAESAKAGAQGR